MKFHYCATHVFASDSGGFEADLRASFEAVSAVEGSIMDVKYADTGRQYSALILWSFTEDDDEDDNT